MENVYLCLDVGGTEIKAAPLDARRNLLRPIRHFPAMAGADRETLLAHFAEIFRAICPENCTAGEIALAFPGPFDYENGICLLQGLAKYDALYGCDLRREFAARTGLPGQKIRFINDAAAFALGELGYGSAVQTHKTLFVAVGTGCGSAFGLDGLLAPEGTPGVPPHGYFYNATFLDSCVDDYISRRGLERLTAEKMGTALDGRALSERAAAGDPAAAACFLQFGERLRDALRPQIEAYHPELVCLGGQIMASAARFLPPLENYCTAHGIRIAITQDTSLRTMQGLTRLAENAR